MATEREIKRLLESVNVTIDIENVIQTINYNKLDQIEAANRIEEFLLKNATFIDMKKLLLVIIESLNQLAEKYEREQISKFLEENAKKELEKAIQFAKTYIKLNEEVKILGVHQEGNAEKMKILTSKQIVYGKEMKIEKNQQYDEMKELIPQIEAQDLIDVFAQILKDEDYIAKMSYVIILENALLQQGYTEKEIDEQYVNGNSMDKIDEIIKNMAQAVQLETFNKSLKEALEEMKGNIEADKYLLFHIYRINQELEKQKDLKEDEKIFLENIQPLLGKLNNKTKIRMNHKEEYGTGEAHQFLTRLNLKTGEYCTEEQLKTGEKLLRDVNGYENYLKRAQLKELAKYEGNLIYLFQKKKISKSDITNILRTRELSEDTVVELYSMGAIELRQLEEYAKQKQMNIEELKNKIKQRKEIDLNNVDLEDKNIWNLLTKEEKIEVLAQMLEKGNDKILEQLEKEEVEKLCDVQSIAQLYQEIYEKGVVDKREKYENLIKIYHLVEKKDKEEIITLLEDELSDEMLLNLYSDYLISMDLLESYGEKELVIKAFNQGKIHKTDIRKVIRRYPIDLSEEQMIEWYQNGTVSIEDMIELYLQDKAKLKTLEKLEENLEEYLTGEELIKFYKQTKKSKESIKYKKYKLLYQTIKEEKIDDKVLGEKGFEEEDIIQFYKDNLLTMEALLSYGGRELVQKLAIEGALKPKDAKEIFQDEDKKIKIEELLKNPNMEDIQKMILIYSTYDDDKEKRDYLVNYLQAHASDMKGKSTTREVNKGDSRTNESKRTITDPYERWKLFSTLDKDYTKNYIDGYLIITLNNLQTTIIEKMYQKKGQEIMPAYGTATFVLDTEAYIKMEDEIVKGKRLDIVTLRKMAKEEPETITKITHHPPMIDSEGKEKNSWGKRLLGKIGNEKIEEIYTQADRKEIEECLRDIEASREALR